VKEGSNENRRHWCNGARWWLSDSFAGVIADLNADVVVDMICFTADSARHLVESLRGRVDQLIVCSTIVRPGHISGPGWAIINPQGTSDLAVWELLASGETLTLPNFGLETLHLVHASDVAHLFHLTIEREVAPAFDVFNAVSPQATTLRGLAEEIATRFGQKAVLEFVPFHFFQEQLSPENAQSSFEHFSRSQSMSIDRARNALGYRPQYSSVEAVSEAISWLCASGKLSAKAAARWAG